MLGCYYPRKLSLYRLIVCSFCSDDSAIIIVLCSFSCDALYSFLICSFLIIKVSIACLYCILECCVFRFSWKKSVLEKKNALCLHCSLFAMEPCIENSAYSNHSAKIDNFLYSSVFSHIFFETKYPYVVRISISLVSANLILWIVVFRKYMSEGQYLFVLIFLVCLSWCYRDDW